MYLPVLPTLHQHLLRWSIQIPNLYHVSVIDTAASRLDALGSTTLGLQGQHFDSYFGTGEGGTPTLARFELVRMDPCSALSIGSRDSIFLRRRSARLRVQRRSTGCHVPYVPGYDVRDRDVQFEVRTWGPEGDLLVETQRWSLSRPGQGLGVAANDMIGVKAFGIGMPFARDSTEGGLEHHFIRAVRLLLSVPWLLGAIIRARTVAGCMARRDG